MISCGDLSASYLDFLATSLGVPLFYVRGNHDAAIGRQYPVPGEDLDGRVVRYKGLTLAGFEGSAFYGGKGVEYSQSHMYYKVLSSLPRMILRGPIDIMVTHAPPSLQAINCMPVELAGAGGVIRPSPCRELGGVTQMPTDAAHAGFSAFTLLLDYVRPRLWLHGHVHLNYMRGSRFQKYGDTVIINADQRVLLEI